MVMVGTSLLTQLPEALRDLHIDSSALGHSNKTKQQLKGQPEMNEGNPFNHLEVCQMMGELLELSPWSEAPVNTIVCVPLYLDSTDGSRGLEHTS